VKLAGLTIQHGNTTTTNNFEAVFIMALPATLVSAANIISNTLPTAVAEFTASAK
jgi:hypothetical protein